MFSSYTIDASDRITAVGGDWDRFALENDGARACADQVLGHQWWEYVDGWETAGFLNALFFWIRRKGVPYETVYRCDSPMSPRLFRMRVDPGVDGALTVGSSQITPVGADARKIVPINDRTTTSRCSICCRFEVGGVWIEPFAIPDVSWFPSGHTVCPDCRANAFHSDRFNGLRPPGGQIVPLRRA